MEIYHLLNRGVDKRNIFLDEKDRFRFVYGLYSFNDTRPIANTYNFSRSVPSLDPSTLTFGPRRSKSGERKPLVDLYGWCLMDNHYHLLVSEREPGGISQFTMKLNVGYAKYFNERYERSGTLFQGRTKKVLIECDQQFNYILHYIHLNPLDYLKGAEDWRIRSKRGIKNAEAALKYLRQYRWSSYFDYSGVKNFSSVITKKLQDNTPGEYVQSLKRYVKESETDSDFHLHLE